MSELQDTAGQVVIVGRGQVIADTSVADLLASVSGDRSCCGRPRAPSGGRAGARRCDRGRHRPDALTISGLPAERVVALLSEAPSRSRRWRPPRDPGAGLPGAHQGRGRVPVRGPGRAGRAGGRHDHDHALPAAAPPGRAGFAHLLHAEWTKFRTVRGWVIAAIVVVLVTVLLGLFQGVTAT